MREFRLGQDLVAMRQEIQTEDGLQKQRAGGTHLIASIDTGLWLFSNKN